MSHLESLGELLSSPVAYHAALARMLKSPTAAIMLSQGWYWQKINKKQGRDFFWVTGEQWYQQTGLTLEHQKTARKLMRDRGFWLESLMGVPAKLYYRIDLKELFDQLDAFLKAEEGENQNLENQEPSFGESPKLDMANPANWDRGIPKSIKKTNNKTNNKNIDNTVSANAQQRVSSSNLKSSTLEEEPLKEKVHRADVLQKSVISGQAVAEHLGLGSRQDLIKAFDEYLEYRKEMRFKKYASVQTAALAMKLLKTCAERSRCTPMEIIDQTRANLWQGLQDLKRAPQPKAQEWNSKKIPAYAPDHEQPF